MTISRANKRIGLLFGFTAILLLAGGNVTAFSACGVNLPRDSVNITAAVHEYNNCEELGHFSSYLDATFSNVTGSYSVGNGIHPGFCADLEGSILDNPGFGPVQYQVQLLSSIDNPPLRLFIPWDLINYVMNSTPNDTWLDKQAAIWSLIHGCGLVTPCRGCWEPIKMVNGGIRFDGSKETVAPDVSAPSMRGLS